ncbi:unnamed protein product, partial [Choristocarpus tenellus]
MVIGAQPRCAELAQERFCTIPKEGRVEKLRPYLKRYELFPPRRNPDNAPIRMEELRALVRRWNLHHRRHFWRNHYAKDDVVGALNKHVKDMKTKQDNVESKKAKKRVADRRRHGQNSYGETWDPAKSSLKRADAHIKRIREDNRIEQQREEQERLVPQTIEEPIETGIIYKSRWGQGKATASPLQGDPLEKGNCNEQVGSNNDVSQPFEIGNKNMHEATAEPNSGKIHAQRNCSSALLNMTLRNQMSKAFLEEFGLLPALLDLMHVDQDIEVLDNCLKSLVNILSEGYKIPKIVEAGAVPVIKALVCHPDGQVLHLTALVLLAFSSQHGLEEWLVQDGAVPALNLLSRNANLHTARLAISSLVNVAVTLTAAQADSMQRLVLRTINNILEEATDVGVLHFCALMTNNLTVLENVRAYLDYQVADIAMSILTKLGPNSNETVALCAATMFNMLTFKSCRTHLAQRNVVAECQRLMDMCGSSVRHSCIMVLAEMSKYSDLTSCLLDGGILHTFSCNLSAAEPHSVAISAAGLSSLAADPENHARVLESEGALTMLINALGVDHIDAQHHVLCLLCGLVSNEATQSKVVLAGVVTAVREMSNRQSHATNISLILYNISCNPSIAGRLIDDYSVIPLLVELVKKYQPIVQAACLGTLQNLSTNTLFQRQMLNGGVMEALEAAKDVDGGALSGQCASVLYNFSHHEPTITQVIELGGVFLLTHLSYAHFNKTKQLCAAAFCNMTLFRVIMDNNFLTSLIIMSNATDFTLVLCCAKTFANLSTYPRGRTFLGGNKSVMPALIAMMRSGVNEAAQVQFLCSIALCNVLSVFLPKEAIINLVTTGVVQDLIAVTVLRVNEVSTKEILARALFNLLARDDTRKFIADQDTVFALIRLTRLQSPDLNTICLRAIHNLSCEISVYESKLLEMGAESMLVDQALFPNGGLEAKKMCGAALAMISSASIASVCALSKVNITNAIRAVMVVKDKDTLEQCATILFNISKVETCQLELAEQEVIGVLVPLHAMCSAVAKNLCIATLCNLSCCLEAHRHISTQAIFIMLGNTIRAAHLSSITRLDALTVVVNLITHYAPAQQAAVETSVSSALCGLLVHEKDKILVSKAFRDMASHTLGHKQIISEGGMGALARLAKAENAQIKQDVATALCRLSGSKELALDMVDEELVAALFWLTLEDLLNLTESVLLRCSVVCRNVALNNDALTKISADGERFSKVLERLASTNNNEIQVNVSNVFLRITSCRNSINMVTQGNMVAIIVGLVETGGEDVKQLCSAALNQLPQHMVKTDGRTVKVLVAVLQLADGGVMGGFGSVISEPSVQDLKQWSLCKSSITENPVSTKASWLNEV